MAKCVTCIWLPMHIPTRWWDGYPPKPCGLPPLSTRLWQAIRQAVEEGEEDLAGLTHHSDRGVQYCCDYTWRPSRNITSQSAWRRTISWRQCRRRTCQRTIKTCLSQGQVQWHWAGKAGHRALYPLLQLPQTAYEHRVQNICIGSSETGKQKEMEKKNILPKTPRKGRIQYLCRAEQQVRAKAHVGVMTNTKGPRWGHPYCRISSGTRESGKNGVNETAQPIRLCLFEQYDFGTNDYYISMIPKNVSHIVYKREKTI